MRSFVLALSYVTLAVLASGCNSIIGIEDLPPANDDAGSSSRGGGSSSSSSSSSTAGPPGTCPGITVSNACDQCLASSCCAEAQSCRNDPNCIGAIGCLQNSGGSIGVLCGCLQSYGGITSYSGSAVFACDNQACGATCGDPLGLGAQCSQSAKCQPGPCVFDSVGTARCLQLCCYDSDCPGAQLCTATTSVEGAATRVCM